MKKVRKKRDDDSVKIERGTERTQYLKTPQVWTTLINLMTLYEKNGTEIPPLFAELMEHSYGHPDFKTHFEDAYSMALDAAGYLLRKSSYSWVVEKHGLTKEDLASNALITLLQRPKEFDPDRDDRQGLVFSYVRSTLQDFLKANESDFERAGFILELPDISPEEHLSYGRLYAQNAKRLKGEAKALLRERDAVQQTSAFKNLTGEYQEKLGAVPLSEKEIEAQSKPRRTKKKAKKTA